MSRPKPLSGFPEFLPAQRIVEQRVLGTLADTFELHGFGSIETRALEPMAQLARKGEIDKEVYVVRRLHAEGSSDAELGLHVGQNHRNGPHPDAADTADGHRGSKARPRIRGIDDRGSHGSGRYPADLLPDPTHLHPAIPPARAHTYKTCATAA